MNEIGGRAARLLGGEFRAWHPVSGGYTNAIRGVVELADGRTAFAKAGPTSDTATWLRTEALVYRDLAAPFMPRMLGWQDAGVPLLLLEDLRRAHWPPPWDPTLVRRVLATLEEIAATPPPPWVPPLDEQLVELAGWIEVARDPAPFLSLGLCTPAWLDAALPRLLSAEAQAPLDGDAFLHVDVRSDNICFDGDRCLLIDWNGVRRGNAMFDVAFWLPSLASEGGPPPQEVLPGEPALAAVVAGFFAARAGLPRIPHAPRVRDVQRTQLNVALPWAIYELGLPPLDG